MTQQAFVINKEETAKEKVAPTETHYLLIVDASSSMTSLTESTISGVNEQINTVKDLEKQFPDQKYYMSFVHFNSSVTIEYFDKKAGDLELINNKNYLCGGMTALLDAIGTGVKRLNDTIKDKIATGEASAVVVIITDGQENSSNEFKGPQIKQMIEELQMTDRWTFTFVGANIDTIGTAQTFGINTANVMNFTADKMSNTSVYKSLTRSFSSRGSKISSGTFNSSVDFLSEEDKDVSTKNDNTDNK